MRDLVEANDHSSMQTVACATREHIYGYVIYFC